jgi:hypothetical protein
VGEDGWEVEEEMAMTEEEIDDEREREWVEETRCRRAVRRVTAGLPSPRRHAQLIPLTPPWLKASLRR